MSLILPKSTVQAMKAERSVADSIQRSAVNNLTSDDFVTTKEVQRQLDELHAISRPAASRTPATACRTLRAGACRF